MDDSNRFREVALSYGVNEHQITLMEDYLLRIIEANKTTNLTRIETVESGMILHLEDSLSGLPELLEAPQGLYGDLGTGGGFPGVPLAIASGRETMLIDSVKKKIAILVDIVSSLSIDAAISGYDGRIEDLAREKSAQFSVLTARALSSLPSLMELASPLLIQGGYLICYKANVGEDELTHAKALAKQLALRVVNDREFTLSDGITHRRILTFEKSGYPSIKLPRRVGMAQKSPL